MNKPITVALAAVAVLTAVYATAVPTPAMAQYGVGGNPTTGATPAQLEECANLGIDRSICTENAILAKHRLTQAQSNPSTGSGTPMLSTDTGQMIAFIGILGAIFGGVAAAFFFKGRGSKPVTT
ncbi:MAG TPA: hypothetical protein VJP79_05225 [Nitrososphaera sp.]|jgi:hypothetical protein|nr:hypothetical protein [Nitrososphaera sp.]